MKLYQEEENEGSEEGVFIPTEEAMKPFITYSDLQDFLDALDDDVLKKWMVRLDKAIVNGENVGDLGITRIAAAMYCIESGKDHLEDLDMMVIRYEAVEMALRLEHMRRKGLIVQRGRLTLLDCQAEFKKTDLGKQFNP